MSRLPHRSALAVLAAATLAVTGLTTTGTPAAAVSGPTACPTAFPTAKAVDGLRGTGFTVERGTLPAPFTARVLGRITDGIAPGVDMIMAQLDSPALRRAGGVWEGMSGSPVYTSDGRLIGAVAYGLSFGPSRIAGLTPGADLRALATDGASPLAGSGVAGRVAVPTGARAALSASGAVTAAQSGGGFSRLQLPLSLSGSSSPSAGALVDRLAGRLPGTRVLTSGAPSGSAGGSAITAAGNVAAALSTGDVTAAAVGTTTLVCDGQVVAFGHPFGWEGRSSYTLHSASAVYVQPDPTLAPFKVANIGAAVGTVDRDRLTGIRGHVGPRPSSLLVRSTLRAPDGTSRTGTTRISDRSYSPDIAALHVLRNVELVLRSARGGSAATTLTVTGTRAGGAPFTLVRRVHVADPYSVALPVADDVYGTLAQVTDQPYERVRLSSVTLNGTVTPTIKQYRVTGVQVKQAGRYVPVAQGSSSPVVAHAGQALPVRLTLAQYQGVGTPRVVDLAVTPPAGSAGSSAALALSAGEAGFFGPPPGDGGPGDGSLDGLLTALSRSTSSVVSADLLQDDGRSVSSASADTGQVVASWSALLPVQVQR